MAFREEEYVKAFARTLSEHTSIRADLGREVIIAMHDLLLADSRLPPNERIPFPEKIRRTMNKFLLKGKDRTAYKFLVGTYFGTRGGKKSAQNQQNKLRTKQAQTLVETDVTSVRKVGSQLSFDF